MRLDRLSLLTPAERRQILEDWNATERSYPADCVHALFEAQVIKSPSSVAVVHDGVALSYAELNAQANRLARHLRGLGVGRDVRVAVCLERSLEMVVGLLAVLKAGGAYVPLDPGYPLERLSFMLDDSATVAMLTHARVSHFVNQLVTGAGVHVVDLEADAFLWSREATSNLHGVADVQDLAYVIYTSGSTGNPKGAMNEHCGVVNRLQWTQEHYRLSASDAVLQKTPLSFDVSVWELFWPLMSGARLVMARADGHKDARYLADLVRDERITVMHFVPSMLQVFLEHDVYSQCATLRHVICSGEALPRSLAVRFRDKLPHVQLSNLYGPTEAAVDVTAWLCPPGTVPASIPIGRPIANTRAYILDAYMEPVPVGVTGELYLGGVQIARGYLKRPELTAERFVPSPFVAGDRLYKTGDLTRYLPDGNIEYIGRNDFQVKIRGFRIELGEIEAHLCEILHVREAVVVAIDDADGQKRLVAYYIVAAACDVRVEELRKHLSVTLPEYMVPAAYVKLQSLPLLPNGKLDRKALPPPDGGAYVSGAYEAPRGEIETAVAQIWGELLKAERVGRHDNFFELGGHSLLAMRVLSRIRTALEIDASLTTLFSHPTLGAFAEALKTSERNALPPITAAERTAALPLSFAQERLWFLAQLDPTASRAYHIPFNQPIKGPLDAASMRRSLDAMVARHEALRTTFVAVNGEPFARIGPAECGFDLVEHDLREEEDPAGALSALAKVESSASFDLEHGPLVRGRLVTLDFDNHVLLVTMHHIVSDGWSMGIFKRELNALYAAYRAGGPTPLAPLPVQYADYAVWQRRWISGDLLQAQAAYWKHVLSGVPALLEIPTDRPRPRQRDYRGGRIGITLDATLSKGLAALSRRHGVTLFMTILTAWASLLSRLSGEADIVVGTAVANRVRPEVENLIGFFINTLALRLDFANDPTVTESLALAKTRSIAGQERQDLPFEQVVEVVNPPRSLAHSPLFQTMFVWQNAETGDRLVTPPRVASRSGAAGAAMAKFDLTLELSERGDRIGGTIIFASALFEQETVERYSAYFERILRAMVADDRQKMSALALLPHDEWRRSVVDWNATDRAYRGDVCIHELFEEQVERSPNAIAVTCEKELVSYQELNARANRLAHYLRSIGVHPDVHVAVCLERSVEMVVGLLGVLKAGGAYVPLDPGYPVDRLLSMLADCAPIAILTHGRISHVTRTMLARSSVRVIDLDNDAAAWSAASEINLSRDGLRNHHLAYVIYTSGSTGNAKGAMNEHRGVVNRLLWSQETFALTGEDAVLQKTPFSFDVSVWELFWPLSSGARLVMARPEGHRDPQYLAELARDETITTLHFVPSMLEWFLDHEDRLDLATVRRVFCSGEALSSALARRFTERFAHISFSNLYGPTETAIEVTAWTLPSAVIPNIIPIGRPIANTRAYILDPHMQPVPVGVIGELHIGGVQVSRGYLNQPELTAQRFVANPFVAFDRLYKTGDLARFRSDGEIEFLGRNDFQVKIRGFRVELGEIEARLRDYPGVCESVVVALGNADDQRRLVAYYTTDDGQERDMKDMRSFLSRALLEHMLPAAFVRLDAMPLTSSGKLDRKALPAPDGQAALSRVYEPPVDKLEKTVAQIWSELLKVEHVGRTDNFFELGGHSLLAMRVLSRVRQELAVEASLTTLFSHPTLIAFARELGALSQNALPAISEADRSNVLPLSFAQERLWFLAHFDPAAGRAYHIPFSQALQHVDQHALQRALDTLVARHETLRTTFTSHNGEPRQRIADAESGFTLLYCDLREHENPASAARMLAEEESGAPFDLELGPLIRGRLVRLSTADYTLFITMHHIISDGWSMTILTRELNALYAAYRAHAENPLAPLSLQYADYASWQRRWMVGDALQRQATYWKNALAGAPVLLELPADHARPPLREYRGSRTAFRIDAQLTANLRKLSRRHETTLFMTLLAAWGALLSRLCGNHDVVVGTAVANRVRPEIEGLIGFFVNTLALRLDFSASPTVSEALARVKTVAIAGQEHQDMPFEQVVELVNPPRSLSHSPLFQTMFVWQNMEKSSNAPAGSEAKSLGASRSATNAKFDLTLELSERGDQIGGSFVYANALFEQETIERYSRYLERLLSAMVVGDAQPMDHLCFVPDDERHSLLVDATATTRPYPLDVCLHELFEAQVVRSPRSVAVVCGRSEYAYEDVNARANRLARHLRGRGVGPDICVAVCLERGLDMVVALLAVLKAGGAYVPLDPSYPPERIAYTLTDSAPAVILTNASVDRSVRTLLAGERPVIDLEADADRWSREAAEDLDRLGLASSHLAYVLYTSGSTGRPKGAMNEHRGVVNRLLWGQEEYGLGAHDAILQKAPFSFDVSVLEIFWPLMSGARLVMAQPHGHADPEYLATTIREQRVTVVHFAPSMLDVFLERAELGNCSTLEHVLCGGEALSRSLAERVRQKLPHVQLSNLYGPTEAAVDVSVWHCPAVVPAIVPIGRPITNTRMYILDVNMEPVPLGVAGELYIGGVQVGRGYANSAELTMERFLASPFVPGDRLFRTGDRVRSLHDGNIEFLGRNDSQLKLRGFGIELGEIEARLLMLPAIREAIVVALDNDGGKKLVAYYTVREAVEVDVETLRNLVSSALPQYMVPAAFVQLESIPLTPNGKLDRARLPRPDMVAQFRSVFEAPIGPVEIALAQIWQDILQCDAVGRHDNFFELGGHSLMTMRLASRLKALGLNLPSVAVVFRHPTLSALAHYLQAQPLMGLATGVIPIRPSGGQAPLFMIHDLFGDDLYFARLAEHINDDIPIYGLPAVPFDAVQLDTIETIAKRMIAMIQDIASDGPYRIAGWSFGGVVAYEVAHQLVDLGATVEFVGLFDSVCSPAKRRGEKRTPDMHLKDALQAVLHHGAPGARRVVSPPSQAPRETTFREQLQASREEGKLPFPFATCTAAELEKICERVAAHQMADESYEPRNASLPIHLFAAMETRSRAHKMLARHPESLGWNLVVAPQDLTIVDIPGDHQSITTRHAPDLGRAISGLLRATASGPRSIMVP